jgi:hypothetical protein
MPSLLDEFDPLRQPAAVPVAISNAPLLEQPAVKPRSHAPPLLAQHNDLIGPILELDRHRPAITRRQGSDAAVSPTEASFTFQSGSPPHTLSRRLSQSLDDDYAPFVAFHHPAPPAHAQSIPPAKPTRPGLAALFKDAPWTVQEGDFEPPAPFFDGAPGFSSHPVRIDPPLRSRSHPSSPAPPAPIVLAGFRPDFTPLLSTDLAESIRPSLPARLRIQSRWTLLYSLDLHGVSLATLYDRVKAGMLGGGCGCVVLIKDGRDNTFGAFVNEALRKQEGYYGSGEWSVSCSPTWCF